jgi:ADP-ribose pyrophosphatase
MARMLSNSPRPWKILSSIITYQDEWLTLRSDKVLLPSGRTIGPYHTVAGPNWVCIIAITTEGNVVLTEEYRHGAGRVILQFPGGHIDDAEEAEAASRRELLEETGYGEGMWYDLGMMFGASARLTAQVHPFLALDVQAIAAPQPDHSEDIGVFTMSWEEFMSEFQAGKLDLPDSSDLGMLMRLQIFASISNIPAISRLRINDMTSRNDLKRE